MNICNRRYIFYSVIFYKIRAVTNYLIVEIKQHYSLNTNERVPAFRSTIVEIKIALQPQIRQTKPFKSTIVEIKIALQPSKGSMDTGHYLQQQKLKQHYSPPAAVGSRLCLSTIVEIKIALQPSLIISWLPTHIYNSRN